MAQLVRDGENLIVRMNTKEKLESVHNDVVVAVSSVRGVDILEDVLHAVGGIKALGGRLPGVFAFGTFISHGEKVFAVVHHGAKRGVRLRLEGEHYGSLVIGCDDPEGVVRSLNLDQH